MHVLWKFKEWWTFYNNYTYVLYAGIYIIL